MLITHHIFTKFNPQGHRNGVWLVSEKRLCLEPDGLLLHMRSVFTCEAISHLVLWYPFHWKRADVLGVLCYISEHPVNIPTCFLFTLPLVSLFGAPQNYMELCDDDQCGFTSYFMLISWKKSVLIVLASSTKEMKISLSCLLIEMKPIKKAESSFVFMTYMSFSISLKANLSLCLFFLLLFMWTLHHLLLFYLLSWINKGRRGW